MLIWRVGKCIILQRFGQSHFWGFKCLTNLYTIWHMYKLWLCKYANAKMFAQTGLTTIVLLKCWPFTGPHIDFNTHILVYFHGYSFKDRLNVIKMEAMRIV